MKELNMEYTYFWGVFIFTHLFIEQSTNPSHFSLGINPFCLCVLAVFISIPSFTFFLTYFKHYNDTLLKGTI